MEECDFVLSKLQFDTIGLEVKVAILNICCLLCLQLVHLVAAAPDSVFELVFVVVDASVSMLFAFEPSA